MLRLTLRSALAHRTRLALTSLAVVLGVAFVTGTLVLTDTMRATVDTMVADAFAPIDVAVLGLEDAAAGPLQPARTPVPAAALDDVRAVDGVAAAVASVQGPAVLLDDAGEPLGGSMTPAIGTAASTDERLSTVEVRDGRLPTVAGEVAVDAATATDHGLVVGDEVDVVAGGPVTAQTITGIVAWAGADEGAGFTLTLFDPSTAHDLFAIDGDYASIHVLAEDGTDVADLRSAIAAATADLPVEVLTGDELRAAESASATEELAFLDQALLGFAAVALFVGAFIILNTFSIIVAQRTRELAMLRALGASRRKVLTTVLGEALVTGVLGATGGIGLGLGVAVGLRALLDELGLSLPTTDLVIAPTTIVTAAVVGIGVTLVAAVLPALRSLQVPPVAAMAAVALPTTTGPGRGRTIAGAVATVFGVLALAAGLFADAGLLAVGGGAVLVLVGFSLLAPLFTRPVLSALAAPVRRTRDLRGELAAENALRNPQRTAATASALMIGLGLVSFAAIFGASITASAASAIGESFRAEFNVRPAGANGVALPDDVTEALADVDGVDVAMPMRSANLSRDAVPLLAIGVDPDVVDEVVALAVVDGDLAGLADGGLAVKESIAVREAWSIGDTVELDTPTGTLTLPLAATIDSGIDASWFLANDTIERAVAGSQVAQVFVDLEEGLEVADVRSDLEAALTGYPTTQLLDSAELQASVEERVDQVLGLLTALLLLSIVIAIVGLVNTLSLSVFERTRELGLLRAVGASRGQVRAMVRWEAVLVAGLGAVLGLTVGVLFGWLLVRALTEQGITTFALPGAQLVAAFVGAGLAGVLASVAPARRAARVDVLRALQAT